MNKLLKGVLGFIGVSLCTSANAALLEADFESFAEGHNGTTITENNITLSNLIASDDFGGISNLFVVDTISDPIFTPFLSSPNVLGYAGYGPGPGFGIGGFGSMDITFGNNKADSASVNIVHGFYSTSVNMLSLQAFYDGQLVASDTVDFLTNPGLFANQTLSVSGAVFNSLRLVSSGADFNGMTNLSIDTVAVNVTDVSEPAAASLVLLGLLGCVGRKRKAAK